MRRFLTPYICIIIFCANFSALHSQNLTLKISTKDSTKSKLLKSLAFKKKHVNEQSLFFEIDSLSILFEKIGFLNNSLDTIVKKDSIYSAQFALGNSIKTIKIYYDQNLISKEILQQVSKKVTNTFFEVRFDLLQKSLDLIVSKFEEKGNSFTEVHLGTIKVSDSPATAKLHINNSKTRTIDKVIIKGIDNFPTAFIRNYFKINQNTVFNLDKLTKISNQIKALPFVSEFKTPEVLFTNDSTYVYLYLKKEKSNKFDGLIGFSSSEENSSLQFNGYLDLALTNIFNGGENILLNWKNNGNDKQLFNFNVEIPYLFNSSLTPKIGLNIYKQDSTFINTRGTIGIDYSLNYKNSIGISYISESSTNLLNNPITNLNTYSTNLYGVNYDYRILNNSLLYPVKFNTNLTLYTGNRKTDNTITTQTQVNLGAYYLWSLNFKNYLYIESNNAILISDNFLTNELFRIGGVNSIRGFNEESIFASTYNIVNIEYRYSTNISSYLYTISDFGRLENLLENFEQNLYSLGLGYAFNTKLGLLNLSYAIGKLDKLPFDFNNSRFHIKILSFF